MELSSLPTNSVSLQPGIIVHNQPRPPRRRSSVPRRRSTLAAAGGGSFYGGPRNSVLSLDRLSYLNTALEALPGMTLQKHFAPIVRLRRAVWERRRLTQARMQAIGPALAAKREKDALQALVKALTEAASDLVLGSSLPLDAKMLGEQLADRLEPVTLRPGGVLYYPQEPPEALFVYIVVEGAVTVTQYQPQTNRPTVLGGARKQYFTSGKETLKLGGGGMLEGALLTGPGTNLLSNPSPLLGDVEGNSGSNDADNNMNNNGSEVASVSNLTTAIQRGLREASRAVGQPTLQAIRSDLLRAPMVFGAAEALGMSPFKSMSCVAASTASNKGEISSYTDVYRVRAVDVQRALQNLAAANTTTQEGGARETHSSNHRRGTLQEFIAAARTKAITTYYHPTEVLLRQSWLLQDTPTATIRNLITHLTPHTFMPGELVSCPHDSNSPLSRRLVFVRRGEINVCETSGMNDRRGCLCNMFKGEEKVLETVLPGSSFGELSLLFGEPRHFVLRAQTACDVWILTHENFSRTMHRDDALRNSLVNKAAALRIKWLGEQRFTAQLAQQLRKSCELFRPLEPYTLRLIQERLEPVVFSPGELVASTSGKCEEMIIIMQGKVTAISGADIVYGKGDVLGSGCLIPHRWPLGLAARTMVEGWRLRKNDLVDALERMDCLYTCSGLYSSEVPVYMQQIFRHPLPEVETDAVGRMRMPTVTLAPGNVSYTVFARQVSEIQLKALCYLFKDYVKWEDICYATLDDQQKHVQNGGRRVDMEQLARQHTVDYLKAVHAKHMGRPYHPPPSIADHLVSQIVKSASRKSMGSTRNSRNNGKFSNRSPKSTTGPRSGVYNSTDIEPLPRPGGVGDSSVHQHNSTTTGPKKAALRTFRKKRSNNTGACAFLVDPDHVAKPFTDYEVVRRIPRRPTTAPTPLNKSAKESKESNETIALQSAARLSQINRRPLRLQRFQRLLDDRDRILDNEARAEELEDRKRALREGNAIQNYLYQQNQQTAPEASEELTTTGKEQNKGTFYNTPAPVHLFLSSQKPRAEITMAEAISIGYILQFPDTSRIQSCVSSIDPDITIGVPNQRGRRRVMALTPNDRHTKNNFLFAASTFADTTVSTVDAQLEMRRTREQERRSKAVKLLTMMKANVDAANIQSEAMMVPEDEDVELERHDESPAREPPADLLITAPVEVRPPSSGNDTPLRGYEGSSVPSTPSPFRASPARGQQQEEMAFVGLLARDPRRALQLLHQRFNAKPAGGGGRLSVQQQSATNSPLLASRSRGTCLWDRLRSTVQSQSSQQQPQPQQERDEEAEEGQQHATEPAVLFSNTEEPLPPLATAVPRDYWRTAAHYTILGGPQSAELTRYFALEDGVLYVDRYGALGTPETAAAGAGGGRPSSSSAGTSPLLPVGIAGSTSTSGTYGANTISSSTNNNHTNVNAFPKYIVLPYTAYAGATPGLLSEMTSPGLPPPSRKGSQWHSSAAGRLSVAHTATATNNNSMVAADITGLGGSYTLTPQDFVMPDQGEAMTVVRRIQRDVNGLNEVAREQARERQRGEEYRPADVASLSCPTLEEKQLMEDWQTAYQLVTKDPLQPVRIPQALLPHAGPDYVARDLRAQAQLAASTWRPVTRAGVEQWQEELDSKRGPNGPRRVLATYGSSQLGLVSPPLATPVAALEEGEYALWVREREELFSNYTRRAWTAVDSAGGETVVLPAI